MTEGRTMTRIARSAVIVIVAIISNQLGAGVAGSLSEVTGELS